MIQDEYGTETWWYKMVEEIVITYIYINHEWSNE